MITVNRLGLPSVRRRCLGTTNIMDDIPSPTPRRQGSPRRRPRVAPVVVSSALLGPGVAAIATEKARKASGRSSVMPGT